MDGATINGGDPLALIPIVIITERTNPANVLFHRTIGRSVIRPDCLQAHARFKRFSRAGCCHMVEKIRHGVGRRRLVKTV